MKLSVWCDPIQRPWNKPHCKHSEVRLEGTPGTLCLGAGLQLQLPRALASQVLRISPRCPQIILFYKDAGSLPFDFNRKKSLFKISVCQLFPPKFTVTCKQCEMAAEVQKGSVVCSSGTDLWACCGGGQQEKGPVPPWKQGVPWGRCSKWQLVTCLPGEVTPDFV